MKAKGFTLIEILIVMGIMAILTSIVLVTYASFNKNKILDADTDTIVETIRQAQSQTFSSKNASQYGVHFASSTVTLFTGSTYSASAPTNQVFNLNTSDLIVGINLADGGSDIVFNRLTGETTDSGTITISSPRLNFTRTVTIYKTGIIQSTGL